MTVCEYKRKSTQKLWTHSHPHVCSTTTPTRQIVPPRTIPSRALPASQPACLLASFVATPYELLAIRLGSHVDRLPPTYTTPTHPSSSASNPCSYTVLILYLSPSRKKKKKEGDNPRPPCLSGVALCEVLHSDLLHRYIHTGIGTCICIPCQEGLGLAHYMYNTILSYSACFLSHL